MVTVISDTKQEFQGEIYYKCGFYFQRNGKRLHRTVYQFYYGGIPKGFAVHHIDGDRANNQKENLALMENRDHASVHMELPSRIEHSKRAILKAIEKARVWHGSEEGHEWHKAQYQRVKDKLNAKIEAKCAHCGNEYATQDTGRNKFCSIVCRAAARRASGVDDIEKACELCGGIFKSNKYQGVKYCSDACRAKTPWGQRRNGKVSRLTPP